MPILTSKHYLISPADPLYDLTDYTRDTPWGACVRMSLSARYPLRIQLHSICYSDCLCLDLIALLYRGLCAVRWQRRVSRHGLATHRLLGPQLHCPAARPRYWPHSQYRSVLGKHPLPGNVPNFKGSLLQLPYKHMVFISRVSTLAGQNH